MTRPGAKEPKGRVNSPHWLADENVIAGKFVRNEFVARVMKHMADQDEAVGSNPPTSDFPPSGIGSKPDTPFNIQEFRRVSAAVHIQNVEEGTTD